MIFLLAQRRQNVARRNLVTLVFITLVLSSACFPQAMSAIQEEPVFRAPFKLRLHIDDDHYYEQGFERIPYVANNEVYLFSGEGFGINVTVSGDQLAGITYQPDIAKADVEFNFTQEKSADGFMMLLVTRNKLKRKLFFDALMTVPGKPEIYKTSVLPVEPNLSNFESWPHPIIQLVLNNFRFSEGGSQ
jgi:hypothetical protein